MRDAYILLPFLILFTILIGLGNGIATNEFYRKTESRNAQQIDAFSLLEIETIKRIKDQFLSFNPKDFSFTAGEWTVDVRFIEEMAEIVYSGSQTVHAVLDYDMVFENVMRYRILDESESDSD